MGQRVTVTVIFSVLALFGWIAFIINPFGGSQKEFDRHLETANDYYARGLYQKSINEYLAALELDESKEVRTKMLDSYAHLYGERGRKVYYDYVEELKHSLVIYKNDPDYVMTLTNLYLDMDDYVSAYKVLNKQIESENTNGEIEDKYLEVKYAYDLGWTTFDNFMPFVNGSAAVENNEKWKYIVDDGSDSDLSSELVYAGPEGDDGIRVVTDKKRSYLVDDKNVIQGIFKDKVVEAGVYSEGLVPVLNGENFGYYDILGDYQFGEYDYAGSFVNGKAAVKDDGKWFIIDKEGEPIDDTTYDEIVLFVDGSYIKNNLMIISKGGKYHIIKKTDDEENEIGVYSDVDVISTGYIAVLVDGKWGYIDSNGETVIEPQYKDARGFSNGLAAVYNGRRWGFIDEEGRIVISCKFIDVSYFGDGKCSFVLTEESYEKNSCSPQWNMISLYNK